MSILRSKLTFITALAVVGMFSTLVFRAYTRQRVLAVDLQKLEENIAQAEGKNKELARLVEYFSDPEHLEKEARVRFNLKKPEEEVLVIPSGLPPSTSTPVVTVRRTFSFANISAFFHHLLSIEKSSP